MPLKFACPHCRIRLSVAQRKAGEMSTCPGCRQSIRIPQPSPASESPSSSAVAAPASLLGDSVVLPESKRAEPGPTSSRPPDESRSESAAATEPVQVSLSPDRLVALPRWVVYCQASLLAVVAGTFFVFGWMIGQTSSSGDRPVARYECQLKGRVEFQQQGQSAPDRGAVVFLLPADAKLNRRPDLSMLKPSSFQPLDNPSIAAIEEAGGRVVRINAEGNFDLTVTGPRDFFVFVISKNAKRDPGESLPKTTLAEIGQFFFPVDELVGDQKIFWQELKINRQSQRVETIAF